MLRIGRAVKQLKNLPLLKHIDAQLWENLLPHVSFRDLTEGETLFSAGRESLNLYLILDGEIGLYMPRRNTGETYYLNSRHKGETAGDFAVLNGGEHLVNAIAARKTRVALFPRHAFENLIGIDPQLLKHVYQVAAELSRRVTLTGVYLDLFGDITHSTMRALLDKSVVRYYNSGETLFEFGDASDGLYIITSGKVIVQTFDTDGQIRQITEVQAPETVGEVSLLADTRRNSRVVASRETTAALLGIGDYQELIATRADLLERLTQLVLRRHLSTMGRSRHTLSDRNFVVLPLDSRVPLRRFVHQLKVAMRAMGTAFSLDAKSFDTLYGRSGASLTPFDDIFHSAIAEWLDDKENRYRSLIYVADQRWNAWTQRCINRADRIVLLATASADNDPGPREIELQLSRQFENTRTRPRLDLVLLHPETTENPSGTAQWLRPRILDAYHHVRQNDPKHFGRLARRLSNQATGIVFSGGGARGYAHLGVQKLIEEQDMPIDYIGGSSMGGLLGASMAMGMSYSEIRELSARFANKKALFDYTLPLMSLMRSAKLTHFCQTVYRDLRIEDCWTPFFSVSSNLADGREVVHDRGPLWEVVRTTISLPGVFSPIPTTNGDLLIDGAVLNTFPVDIMQQKLGGRGFVIGVNVSQIPEQFNYYDFGPSLSGWRILLSRLNPFEQRIAIPRIAETLLRSTDIKGIERLNETRQSLDVLIEPNVRSIALLDFKSYEKISELGYAEARAVFQRQGLLRTQDVE